MLEKQRMQVLLLRIKKIQHDQDDMHGMANMMRCNLSILIGVGTPDKQIRVGVAFSIVKFKGGLAWYNMARVRYFKVKRSGETIVGV
jgi:hypothetical protein